MDPTSGPKPCLGPFPIPFLSNQLHMDDFDPILNKKLVFLDELGRISMHASVRSMTRYFHAAIAAANHVSVPFKDSHFQRLSHSDLQAGRLQANCAAILWKLYNGERRGPPEAVPLLLCAKAFRLTFLEAVQVRKEQQPLTGFFYMPALLQDAAGTLCYDPAAQRLPWFSREFLQPTSESALSVGHIADVNRFLATHVSQYEQINGWADYYAYCRRFYDEVARSPFGVPELHRMDGPDWKLEDEVYAFIDPTIEATFHIEALYDRLLGPEGGQHDLALYHQLLRPRETPLRPAVQIDAHAMAAHSGQMGARYPLSPSQREALHHFHALSDGEVLSVNGPPGTGKTTLLQSVVADLYVRRALEERPAPVIVAASTNNQAVTNIIESFGQISRIGLGVLEERWLEGVHSFATYFPSQSKDKVAEQKGYQYTDANGRHFVGQVDTPERLAQDRRRIREACGQAFGRPFATLADCQATLLSELRHLHCQQETYLSLAEKASCLGLKGRTLGEELERLSQEQAQAEAAKRALDDRVDQWRRHWRQAPAGIRRFVWTKARKAKLLAYLQLHMQPDEVALLDGIQDFPDLLARYGRRKMDILSILNRSSARQRQVEALRKQVWEILSDLQSRHVAVWPKDKPWDQLDLSLVNERLDMSLRYVSFWLAVHYNECRWANGADAVTDQQRGKTFPNVLMRFYRRLALISPCLVMTFYMLPKAMRAFVSTGNYTYLFEFIDLLIVDEAGQVSPEIAAASFSLAKQALVVGDIHQIEPVWHLDAALDHSLAQSAGLSPEVLEASGRTCSASSLMQAASASCPYEKFGQRGLFLSEHRRCYDEIIAYCNDLVYHGRLEPLRGPGKVAPALSGLPFMGHFQVDSAASKRAGTSRYNPGEAQAVLDWLQRNAPALQAAYGGKPLSDIVGIITPFKAQADYLRQHLRQTGLGAVDVGTVHTFQGAERPVIVFSTVYGQEDGCYFINHQPNLMNVAVSRAKDHFLVVGELACLDTGSGSASGLLRRALSPCPATVGPHSTYNKEV